MNEDHLCTHISQLGSTGPGQSFECLRVCEVLVKGVSKININDFSGRLCTTAEKDLWHVADNLTGAAAYNQYISFMVEFIATY